MMIQFPSGGGGALGGAAQQSSGAQAASTSPFVAELHAVLRAMLGGNTLRAALTDGPPTGQPDSAQPFLGAAVPGEAEGNETEASLLGVSSRPAAALASRIPTADAAGRALSQSAVPGTGGGEAAALPPTAGIPTPDGLPPSVELLSAIAAAVLDIDEIRTLQWLERIAAAAEFEKLALSEAQEAWGRRLELLESSSEEFHEWSERTWTQMIERSRERKEIFDTYFSGLAALLSGAPQPNAGTAESPAKAAPADAHAGRTEPNAGANEVPVGTEETVGVESAEEGMDSPPHGTEIKPESASTEAAVEEVQESAGLASGAANGDSALEAARATSNAGAPGSAANGDRQHGDAGPGAGHVVRRDVAPATVIGRPPQTSPPSRPSGSRVAEARERRPEPSQRPSDPRTARGDEARPTESRRAPDPRVAEGRLSRPETPPQPSDARAADRRAVASQRPSDARIAESGGSRPEVSRHPSDTWAAEAGERRPGTSQRPSAPPTAESVERRFEARRHHFSLPTAEAGEARPVARQHPSGPLTAEADEARPVERQHPSGPPTAEASEVRPVARQHPSGPLTAEADELRPIAPRGTLDARTTVTGERRRVASPHSTGAHASEGRESRPAATPERTAGVAADETLLHRHAASGATSSVAPRRGEAIAASSALETEGSPSAPAPPGRAARPQFSVAQAPLASTVRSGASAAPTLAVHDTTPIAPALTDPSVTPATSEPINGRAGYATSEPIGESAGPAVPNPISVDARREFGSPSAATATASPVEPLDGANHPALDPAVTPSRPSPDVAPREAMSVPLRPERFAAPDDRQQTSSAVEPGTPDTARPNPVERVRHAAHPISADAPEPPSGLKQGGLITAPTENARSMPRRPDAVVETVEWSEATRPNAAAESVVEPRVSASLLQRLGADGSASSFDPPTDTAPEEGRSATPPQAPAEQKESPIPVPSADARRQRFQESDAFATLRTSRHDAEALLEAASTRRGDGASTPFDEIRPDATGRPSLPPSGAGVSPLSYTIRPASAGVGAAYEANLPFADGYRNDHLTVLPEGRRGFVPNTSPVHELSAATEREVESASLLEFHGAGGGAARSAEPPRSTHSALEPAIGDRGPEAAIHAAQRDSTASRTPVFRNEAFATATHSSGATPTNDAASPHAEPSASAAAPLNDGSRSAGRSGDEGWQSEPSTPIGRPSDGDAKPLGLQGTITGRPTEESSANSHESGPRLKSPSISADFVREPSVRDTAATRQEERSEASVALREAGPFAAESSAGAERFPFGREGSGGDDTGGEAVADEADVRSDAAPFHAAAAERGDEAPAIRSTSTRATAATPTWASTTQPEQLHDIVRSVLVSADDDVVRELQIRLIPEHLGEMQLRLALENGALRAHFVADSDAARQALEQSLPVLQELLESHGVEIHELSVSVGRDTSHFAAGGEDDRSFEQRGDRPGEPAPGEPHSPQVQPQYWEPTGSGVNLLA